MARAMTVTESVVIAADPATVYANVSDPTQTGRWSPENLGATISEAKAARAGLTVGSIFVGHNKRGRYRWSTRCRVIAAEADRRFAFRVEAIGRHTPRINAPIATWEYVLEPVDGAAATKVTETWTDLRAKWPDGLARVFDKLATGSTFAAFNTRNIRTSLDNLKRTLEG